MELSILYKYFVYIIFVFCIFVIGGKPCIDYT